MRALCVSPFSDGKNYIGIKLALLVMQMTSDRQEMMGRDESLAMFFASRGDGGANAHNDMRLRLSACASLMRSDACV